MILGSDRIIDRLTAWFMRKTASNGVRRVAALSAAVATDVGSVRDENQDRVAIARGQNFAGRSFILVALSDGIGGMKEGTECAATALGGFFGAFFQEVQSEGEPEIWLSRAAYRSNLAVHAKLDGAGGATLAAVLISASGSVHWVSVGDSRVQHWDGTKLTQISVDDTIAGQLGKQIDSGLGQSNLLQFIGMGKQLDPHVSRLDTELKGSILLTSDGVHFLDSVWLGEIVRHSPDPGVCVRRLTELAKWCGGPDNASVAIISLDVKVDNPALHQETEYDIWDPFGEMRLIVDVEPRIPTTSKRPEINAPKSTAHEAPVSPAKNPGAQTKAGQPKSKRTGRPRKSKRSQPVRDSEIGKSDDAKEVPQLHIEFPKKAN